MDQNGDGKDNSRATAPTVEPATAPALPDDVLVEILLLLPAKSILRLRAVCKSWRLLLSDTTFIRDHHRRAPLALLLSDTSIDDVDAYSSLPFPHTDQSTVSRLYCGISSQNMYLEGCCDGLLLLSCSCLWPDEDDLGAKGNQHRYFLCNPATREFARLPLDLGQVTFVGFYRHAPTGEYRVLYHNSKSAIQHPYEIYEYLVAAAGQNTARLLGSSNLWTDNDWPLVQVPVTLGGCLHWMMLLPSMGTVVFDTITEEFRLMRGPVDGDTRMDGKFIQLVGVDKTLGAWLFVAEEGALKLWVLESYKKEVWAFRYNIDPRFLDRDFFSSVSLVHVTDGGDAVLMAWRQQRVGVYNLKRGEVVCVMQEPFHNHLEQTEYVYQESLLSPAPKGVGALLHHRDNNLSSCIDSIRHDWMRDRPRD